MKGRLRHLPKKWATLQRDIKESIINELQIASHTKKCCSACFTRIQRRISLALGGGGTGSNSPAPAEVKQENSSNNANKNKVKSESSSSSPALAWTDEETEAVKKALRAEGRNWAAVSERVNGNKTADQCKKFFYSNRKKLGLDKIVLEYKRANQVGDQPPTLSTDEESGSSTSSCDEDNTATPASVNHNPSGSNSPVVVIGGVKKEEIKTESDVKMEVGVSSASTSSVSISQQAPSAAMAHVKTKEEDYDSSATMSADETGDSHGRQVLPPGYQPGPYVSPRYPAGSAPRQTFPAPTNPARGFGAPSAPAAMRPPQMANGPRETITVKELMINVIERSLSTSTGPQSGATPARSPLGQQQAAHPPGSVVVSTRPGQSSQQPSVSPTIHTLLEHSTPARAKGSMAPPPNPSAECETLDLSMPRRRDETPPPVASGSSQYREPLPSHHPRSSPNIKSEVGVSSAPPPAHSGNKKTTNPDPFYSDPHRQSPSVVYGSDGRPLSTPPHMLNRTAPSPGLNARGASSRPGSAATVQYVPRAGAPKSITAPISPKLTAGGARPIPIPGGSITQGTPVSQVSALHIQRPYDAHYKVDKPGSITHGTPVHPADKAKYQQIINVSEQRQPHYDRRSAVSPAASTSAYYHSSSAATVTTTSASRNDPHLSSRQVIMNDYAMARSTEMQRRPPEFRDHSTTISVSTARSVSPPRHPRDHSPRPRILSDPRSQLEIRGDPRSIIDPRYASSRAALLPEQRGDPKADIRSLDARVIDSRGVSLDPRAEPRGDPRAILDVRGDPRARLEIRGDPRAVLEQAHAAELRQQQAAAAQDAQRRLLADPRTAAAALDPRLRPSTSSYTPTTGAQVYMTADGKYVPASAFARSRSPPPSSSRPPIHASAALLHRAAPPPGGISSGKPIIATKPATAPQPQPREVEIIRTNNPEVTISKTSGPPSSSQSRSGFNDLNSLVDLAIQQPKLQQQQEAKERERAAAVALLQQQQQQAAAAQAAAQAAVAKQRQMELDKARLAAAQAAAASVVTSTPSPRPPSVPSAATVISTISAAAAAAATSTPSATPPSIVESVRSEREKQLSLIRDMETQDKTTSSSSTPATSSVTVTPASATPPQQPSGEGRMVTAATLIDAVITNALVKGPSVPEDGGAIPDRTPRSNKSPAELAAATPQEENAAVAAAAAAKLAKQQQALSNGPVAEESKKAEDKPTEATSRPVIEPISPPSERASPAASTANNGKPPAEGGRPGLSPLDYVTNKIREEMTKGQAAKEEEKAASDAAPATGVKRPHEDEEKPQPIKTDHANTNGEEAASSAAAEQQPPEKKPRSESPVNETSKETQQVVEPPKDDLPPTAPDSPGSEGEMVIDESVRPESANETNQPTTTTAENATSSEEAKTAPITPPTPPPSSEPKPQAASSTATEDATTAKAAAPQAPKPQYEPLSDDD